MDATFKVANKAVVIDKDKKWHKIGKGGVLSIINEFLEILIWISTASVFVLNIVPIFIHSDCAKHKWELKLLTLSRVCTCAMRS